MGVPTVPMWRPGQQHSIQAGRLEKAPEFLISWSLGTRNRNTTPSEQCSKSLYWIILSIIPYTILHNHQPTGVLNTTPSDPKSQVWAQPLKCGFL